MLAGINILLVEDNLLNQKIGKYALAKHHANVTTSESGMEALDLLRRNEFDIVLMDIHMPGIDGYETTRIIRSDLKSTIPVIALTASIADEDEQPTGLEAVNATISKPFDTDDLCALILKLTAKPDQ